MTSMEITEQMALDELESEERLRMDLKSKASRGAKSMTKGKSYRTGRR